MAKLETVLHGIVDIEGRYTCGKCGKKSAPVRRTNTDGMREVRYPSGVETFFYGWGHVYVDGKQVAACRECSVEEEEWVTCDKARRRMSNPGQSETLRCYKDLERACQLPGPTLDHRTNRVKDTALFRMRQAMAQLWRALTPEERMTVTKPTYAIDPDLAGLPVHGPCPTDEEPPITKPDVDLNLMPRRVTEGVFDDITQACREPEPVTHVGPELTMMSYWEPELCGAKPGGVLAWMNGIEATCGLQKDHKGEHHADVGAFSVRWNSDPEPRKDEPAKLELCGGRHEDKE